MNKNQDMPFPKERNQVAAEARVSRVQGILQDLRNFYKVAPYDEIPFSGQRLYRVSAYLEKIVDSVVAYWGRELEEASARAKASALMTRPAEDSFAEVAFKCDEVFKLMYHALYEVATNREEGLDAALSDCEEIQRLLPKSATARARREMKELYPASMQKTHPAPACQMPEGYAPEITLLFLFSRTYRIRFVLDTIEPMFDLVPAEKVSEISESRFCRAVVRKLIPQHARFFLMLCALFLEKTDADGDALLDVRLQPDGHKRLFELLYDTFTLDPAEGEAVDYESIEDLERLRRELQCDYFRGVLPEGLDSDEHTAELNNEVLLLKPYQWLSYSNDMDALWATRLCVRFFDDFGFDRVPGNETYLAAVEYYLLDRTFLCDVLNGNDWAALGHEITGCYRAKDEDEYDFALHNLFDIVGSDSFNAYVDMLGRESGVSDETAEVLLWALMFYLRYGMGSAFLVSAIEKLCKACGDEAPFRESQWVSVVLSLARAEMLQREPYRVICEGRLGNEVFNVQTRTNALCMALSYAFGFTYDSSKGFLAGFKLSMKEEEFPESAHLPCGILDFVCMLAMFAHDSEQAFRNRFLLKMDEVADIATPDGSHALLREELQELKKEKTETEDFLARIKKKAEETEAVTDEKNRIERDFHKKELSYREEISTLKKLLQGKDRTIAELQESNTELRADLEGILSAGAEEKPSFGGTLSSEDILARLRNLTFIFVGGHNEVIRRLAEDGIRPQYHLLAAKAIPGTVTADCLVHFTDWMSHILFYTGEKFVKQVGMPRIFVSGSTNYDLVLQKMWTALPEALKKKAESALAEERR